MARAGTAKTNARRVAAYIGKGIVAPIAGGGVLVTVLANSVIAAVGPSTVAGQSTGGGTSQAVNSWPSKLTDLLRASGRAASGDNLFADHGSWGLAQSLPNYVTGDGRVSFTGDWVLGPNQVAGGNCFTMGGSGGGPFAFAPTRPVVAFEVYWRNTGTGNSWTWSIDGGATTQVDSSAAFEVKKTIIPAGAAGVHTLRMARVSGFMHFDAVVAVDAAGDTIRVYNWGICGADGTTLNDNSANPGPRRGAFAFHGVDLSLIEGGLINDWRQGRTVADAKADLTLLAQTALAAKTGAKALLMTPVFDNGVAGNSAIQEQYVTAMREVAATLNVPILDVRATFQSWAYANSQGWMSDSVHPTAAGYAVIAGLVRTAVGIAA